MRQRDRRQIRYPTTARATRYNRRDRRGRSRGSMAGATASAGVRGRPPATHQGEGRRWRPPPWCTPSAQGTSRALLLFSLALLALMTKPAAGLSSGVGRIGGRLNRTPWSGSPRGTRRSSSRPGRPPSRWPRATRVTGPPPPHKGQV